MHEDLLKETFIQIAAGQLREMKKALRAVEKQLQSGNENAIKLAVAWSRISHEFLLEDATKKAMLAIQDKPIYPH